MILDSQISFANAQVVTSTGDTPSTNVYDTGQTYDSALARDQYILARVNAAATSGGGATLQVVLQDSADNSAFADAQLLTPAIPLASLTLNKVLCRTRLPAGMRRYWRIVWRVGTAALTAGTFSADLVNDVQAQQILPTAFTVS